jgi:hypothetical protein
MCARAARAATRLSAGRERCRGTRRARSSAEASLWMIRSRPRGVARTSRARKIAAPTPMSEVTSGEIWCVRAYIEALLEGVPLPAEKSVLLEYAKREGDRDAAKLLKSLRSGRYGLIAVAVAAQIRTDDP